ncbi:MAG: hypothetical protein LBG64_01390 [Pseudomonadales bacterium]|jgi:hypothetical protein|nr:hypothetical protein [Pseudomonadales bacterium]
MNDINWKILEEVAERWYGISNNNIASYAEDCFFGYNDDIQRSKPEIISLFNQASLVLRVICRKQALGRTLSLDDLSIAMECAHLPGGFAMAEGEGVVARSVFGKYNNSVATDHHELFCAA